jgi:hypothetical protein
MDSDKFSTTVRDANPNRLAMLATGNIAIQDEHADAPKARKKTYLRVKALRNPGYGQQKALSFEGAKEIVPSAEP